MDTSIRHDVFPTAAPPPVVLAANDELASGRQATVTALNVWQTQTLSLDSWQGHDYMHARYYNPNLGRFLSVDPVGGEVGSSQSWNRYSYVLNNPLVMVDPFGERWFDINGEWMYFEGVDELNQTVVDDKGNSTETRVQGLESLTTFDGTTLTYYGTDGQVSEFEARAGRLDASGNTQPELQDQVDIGPIPEGTWSFNPQEIQQFSDLGAWDRFKSIFGGSAWPGGASSWGDERVWLNPETYNGPRDNFTIHGGSSFGSRGCIDLAQSGPKFFNAVDRSTTYVPVFVAYP